MSKKPFDKFINKVESGAKKKERIRQEKKKIRAEKNAYFDEQKKLARERRAGGRTQVAGDREQGTDYKVKGRGLRVEGKKNETPQSNVSGVRKAGSRNGDIKHKPGLKKGGRTTTSSGEQHSGDKREHKGYRFQDTSSRIQHTGYRKEGREEHGSGKQVVVNKAREAKAGTGERISGNKEQGRASGIRKHDDGRRDSTDRTAKSIHKKTIQAPKKSIPGNKQPSPGDAAKDQMPLNKFIAWSGVCGRREAAGLIKAGKVIVNNQVIKEPPFRVSQSDNIKVNGKKIAIQKNLVYILLNKPKDYITTTDDPEGRKTVMDLVKRATEERVFPVGRLDRNTTGVLLLTNDGELAQRLTHPKYEVKKIYEVRVDKPVTKAQLDKIASGITLEDGFIQPDAVAYADSKDKSIVGIEIHSGKNRIVRRIFEHLGFKVKNLDRVMYGIFTKKNVDRGKWRLLTEKEIRLLKHLNTSFGNKKTS
ncbi:pseudouridine synthase [Agriterribacter sp.]|uniref:pseudouridine synthase n=1 Tax=Agriterribacter sp. TaxID=2821509 RepID=UPI002C9072C1|nr:pseudouridine synthase [Agriterribacter sp.]HRO46859.1 pseudouridine synthase [Agriterribacter sp.]HRQ18196.1 pseudouridine synthase [Agriterribacter sp.]